MANLFISFDMIYVVFIARRDKSAIFRRRNEFRESKSARTLLLHFDIARYALAIELMSCAQRR